MTDYNDLIRRLRGNTGRIDFANLMSDAADAIEDLLAWHDADAREIERQSLIANGLSVVTCGECKYRHDFKQQGCQGRKSNWFCADGMREKQT